MADDVSVTFSAQIDSFTNGTAQVSAAMQRMSTATNASALQVKAAFAQIESSAQTASAAAGAVGSAAPAVAAGIDRVAASAHAGGVGMAFYAREAHALMDELLSGRITQAQGTFANLAFTVLQANPGMIGIGLAAVAAAGSIGYLVYQVAAMNSAVQAVQMTAAVSQISMTRDNVVSLISAVKDAADVSSTDAGKIAQSFLQLGDGGDIIARIAGQYLPLLAQAMGGDAVQAADKLSGMFRDLSGAGRQYVADTKGVSAATLESYDRYVATGEAGKAYQIIVDGLTQRLEASRETQVRNTSAVQDGAAAAMSVAENVNMFSSEEQALSGTTAATTAKIEQQVGALQQLRSALGSAANAQQQYTGALAAAAKFDVLKSQIDQTRNSIQLMSEQLKVATASNDTSGVDTLTRGLDRANDSLKKLQQQSADGILQRDAVTQVNERLAAIDNAWKGSTVDRVQAEKAALTQILNDTSLTAAQRHQVEIELAGKDKELRDAAYRQFEANENLKVTKANQNKAAIIGIRQEEYQRAVATYGQDSDQAIAAMQQVEQARNAAANQHEKAAKSTQAFDNQTANNEKQAALEALDVKVTAIKEAASEREIDFATERRQLLDIAVQRRAVELQYVNDRSSTASQILKIDADYAKNSAKIYADVNKQIYQDYKTTFEQIGSNVSNEIGSLIKGQETFGQAAGNIALSIVQDWIAARIKMAADWAAGQAAQVASTTAAETAKTAAVSSGVAARTAAEASGSAASLVSTGDAVLKSIAASASETFAGIFGFLSPVMGPAAAGPAAAGEATVAAAAGSVPSFAVGAWALPSDMLAQVHQGEMIIPSGPAQAVRNALSGSPGSGPSMTFQHSTHLNISAVDASGVADFFRNNSKPLMRALNDAVQKGAHLGLAKFVRQ